MRPGRLRRGREFDTVYKQGARQGGPLLVVRSSPNGLEGARWGFAVGKRLDRRSTRRNLLRRRLREAARSLPVAPGADIIVTARPAAQEATFVELRRALESTLRRAGLLSDP